MRKAVVDVGSNSVLLVVGEMFSGRLKVVHEETRVTGLGAGVRATGRLSDEGIQWTLEALRDFFHSAESHGALETIARATMAARIATNRDTFLQMAADQATPVKILSGEEEAELGFRSVSDDEAFFGESRIAIIDPGGNSTELVLAEKMESEWQVGFRKSFAIGTLGLRDGLLGDESPNPDSLLRAVAEIDAAIGEVPALNKGTAVVLGASGTNLVTLKKKLALWDPHLVHGERLEYEEIGRAVGWLSAMTDAQRASLVGLEKGREKTIHLGALILERFMHAIRVEQVTVSVRGWRHALLKSLFS